MAKATIFKEVKITLVLTEEESKWLKSMVQNYLGQGEESEESYEIRKKIWDALSTSQDDA